MTERIDAAGLVRCARLCAERLSTVYVYGGLGETVTAALLEEKAALYPAYYTPERLAVLEGFAGRGYRGFDCSGLVNRCLMGGLAGFRYEEALDWDADEMYERAPLRGPLDTLPERPGLLLYLPGHVGVYAGAGDVIEATPSFRRGGGVQRTALGARRWESWYRHALIRYD